MKAIQRFGVCMGVVAAGIASACVAAEPQVQRINSSRGTIVLERYDPQVQVEVFADGERIVIRDAKSEQQLELKAGELVRTIGKSKGGLKLATSQFRLERDGVVLVSVRLEEAAKPMLAVKPQEPPADDPDDLYNLGVVLEGQGKFASAAAAYRKAIERRPDFFEAMVRLGELCGQKLGDHVTALGLCRRCVALRPADGRFRYNLGNCLMNLDLVDEAIEAYQSSLTIGPEMAEAHCNLAHALMRRDRFAEAVEHMQRGHEMGQLVKGWPYPSALWIQLAERLEKGDATAYLDLVQVMSKQGAALPAVEEALRRALQKQPGNPQVAINLGIVLCRQGKIAQGLVFMRQGHEIGSDQPDWQVPSLQLLREAEAAAQLENRLHEKLDGKPVTIAVNESLAAAQLLALKRLYRQSAELYRDALSQLPQEAADPARQHRLHAACAAVLAGSGQGDDAGNLTAEERASLRQLAREMLRADLLLMSKHVQSGHPELRRKTVELLLNWQRSPSLVGIRHPTLLAFLDEEERRDCERLWAEVETLLQLASK